MVQISNHAASLYSCGIIRQCAPAGLRPPPRRSPPGCAAVRAPAGRSSLIAKTPLKRSNTPASCSAVSSSGPTTAMISSTALSIVTSTSVSGSCATYGGKGVKITCRGDRHQSWIELEPGCMEQAVYAPSAVTPVGGTSYYCNDCKQLMPVRQRC